MKLNLECIRDALIELESFQSGCYHVNSFEKTIEKHGFDNVRYTLAKLIEGGYVHGSAYRSVDGFIHVEFVYDLSFSGHEYLADIKPKNTWEILSEGLHEGRGASLKTVGNVAVDIGTTLLKKKLGLD